MIEKDRKIISLDEAVADANEKSRNRLVDESYVEEVIQKVELVKKRFRQESECQSSGVIPQEKRESLNQILDFLDWLEDGYDPTRAISTICARQFMQRLLKCCQVDLFTYFENVNVRAEIAYDKAVWESLKSRVVLWNESNFMQRVVAAFENKVYPSAFNENCMKQFPLLYVHSVAEAAESLNKCRTDVYIKKGPIGKLIRLNPKILIFTRMSECLLYLEKQVDGVYVCYITQHEENLAALSYFSIFVKSNGTLVSVHNREDVPEFGYGAPNGWLSYCSDYTLGFPHRAVYGFLYKDGNIAPKEGLEMDFESLEPDEAFSLMVHMYLVKTKYEGKEVDQEPIYINSLMRDNYLAEHDPAALSEAEKSEIFAWNQTYKCGIDPKVAVSTSEYNDRFGMDHRGDFWMNLYGSDYVPDVDYVQSALRPFEYRGKDLWLYAECIGPAERMDREVYRVIRKHLAEDIDRKIQSEYRSHPNESIKVFWQRLLRSRKERVLDWICKAEYAKKHLWIPGIDNAAEKNILEHIEGKYKPKKVDEVLNRNVSESLTRKGVFSEAIDDLTGTKCTIFYQIRFEDWKEMEAVYGEDLPLVLKGYRSPRLGKSDRPDAEVTDAVGDLVSPINGQDLSMCLGFSKNGFKAVYKDWLNEHGYADGRRSTR